MEQAYTFGSVSRKPSAFGPVAMSNTALLMVIGTISADLMVLNHEVRDPDEGTIALLRKILMTVQMPFVLFFAAKWLRRAPKQAWRVLALQAGA